MFDAVRGPSTHARSSRFEHVIQVLSFGTIVNGNAMTSASGVGHTVRSNGSGRAIEVVRLLVPNKVHRHHRTDQRFPSRHRAVHLASRVVAQGAVWRGQLHFWIHVEVGGKILARTRSRWPHCVPQLILRTWRFDTCTLLPYWRSTRWPAPPQCAPPSI